MFSQLQSRRKLCDFQGFGRGFTHALGKKTRIFQTHPPQLEAAQQKKPQLSQKPLTAVMGASLTPRSQKTTHATEVPPPLLPSAWSEQASSPPASDMAHDWPCRGRACDKRPAKAASRPQCLQPSDSRGEHLPARPSWCATASHKKVTVRLPSQRTSPGRRQPRADSGVSSIITPLSLWDLCLNEACFLPDAISFYPGWRLKADQWGQYIWCHFNLQPWPPPLQSVWNTQKDQFFPKMVKKCLGSILLPEKHSLLYLSMLLCRELFTWNKNRRHGGEGEISNSVCWRLAGCNSTQAGSFESHTQEAFGQKHNRNRFSFAPWIKKVIPLHKISFIFIEFPQSQTNPLSLFPENIPTTSADPQVAPPVHRRKRHPLTRCPH